jgi:hypothetical protein
VRRVACFRISGGVQSNGFSASEVSPFPFAASHQCGRKVVSAVVSVGFSFFFATLRSAARIVSRGSRINAMDFAVRCRGCAVLREAENGLKGRCSTTELRP